MINPKYQEKGGTLAILQNQWGHSASGPEYAVRLARLNIMSPKGYARHVEWCLVASGCATYRNLLSLYGQEAFERIVWTNASRGATNTASGVLKGDLKHLDATIAHFEPARVIVFGRVALDALKAWILEYQPERTASPVHFDTIMSPHPTARHSGCGIERREAAAKWKAWADASGK